MQLNMQLNMFHKSDKKNILNTFQLKILERELNIKPLKNKLLFNNLPFRKMLMLPHNNLCNHKLKHMLDPQLNKFNIVQVLIKHHGCKDHLSLQHKDIKQTLLVEFKKVLLILLELNSLKVPLLWEVRLFKEPLLCLVDKLLLLELLKFCQEVLIIKGHL